MSQLHHKLPIIFQSSLRKQHCTIQGPQRSARHCVPRPIRVPPARSLDPSRRFCLPLVIPSLRPVYLSGFEASEPTTADRETYTLEYTIPVASLLCRLYCLAFLHNHFYLRRRSPSYSYMVLVLCSSLAIFDSRPRGQTLVDSVPHPVPLHCLTVAVVPASAPSATGF